MPGNLKGCGRGLFGLKSWEPIERKVESSSSHVETTSSQSSAPPVPEKKTMKQRMVAKFSYKANQDSPLGGELDVKQGEKLFFVEAHENNHWWLAQNDDGDKGYVPANYMMILEDKSEGLPWLKNKTEEELPPVQTSGTFKAYKSSYNHDGLNSKQEPLKKKEFYCDVCDKQLNGPQPYKAHIFSRAHKDAVEDAEYYKNQ